MNRRARPEAEPCDLVSPCAPCPHSQRRMLLVGHANGGPAARGDQFWECDYRSGSVMVLHGNGDRIDWLASFVDSRLGSEWAGGSARICRRPMNPWLDAYLDW